MKREIDTTTNMESGSDNIDEKKGKCSATTSTRFLPLEMPSPIIDGLAEFQDQQSSHCRDHDGDTGLKRPRTDRTKVPLLPIALMPNERISSLPSSCSSSSHLPALKLQQRRSWRKPMMPLHYETTTMMAAVLEDNDDDPYASPYAGVHYVQEPPRLLTQQCGEEPSSTSRKNLDLLLMIKPLPPGAHLPDMDDLQEPENDDDSADYHQNHRRRRRFKLKRRPLPSVQSSLIQRHPASAFEGRKQFVSLTG